MSLEGHLFGIGLLLNKLLYFLLNPCLFQFESLNFLVVMARKLVYLVDAFYNIPLNELFVFLPNSHNGALYLWHQSMQTLPSILDLFFICLSLMPKRINLIL